MAQGLLEELEQPPASRRLTSEEIIIMKPSWTVTCCFDTRGPLPWNPVTWVDRTRG